MQPTNQSCAVAFTKERNNATDTGHATGNATTTAKNTPKVASLQELRAQLRAQLVRNYNGDCEAEKQAELRTSESATATDAAELRALVNRVADHHGFTAEQRSEALQIALADSTAALECFRTLADYS